MSKQLTFLLAVALLTTGASTPAAAQHASRELRTAEYRALQTKLCSGWNTWSANSVLAHVHLPDSFALTLGFKSAGIGHAYQNTFFQANETVRRPEKIRLGPHTDDGSYTELTVEWNTNGAGTKNAAEVQSATENGEEYILITVQQHAPLRPEHLIVETGYYWNRPGTIRRDGSVLRAQSGREGGRAFEVRTTSPEVNDPFVTTDAPYLSVALEGRIAVYTGPEKTLEQVAAIIEAHRAAQMKRLADFTAKTLKSSPRCRPSWAGT